ncbi:hypothetical protein [Candidatus Ichthyocystis hellenicum]|uniref:hypothetical protein n=1 Tax=Candidatus Ichthyocystis hellenicum TaxID=1561003 RepID=UPI000B81A421|nr:hypothetical protein [Candidatus Ichthyocystis hellenicum]
MSYKEARAGFPFPFYPSESESESEPELEQSNVVLDSGLSRSLTQFDASEVDGVVAPSSTSSDSDEIVLGLHCLYSLPFVRESLGLLEQNSYSCHNYGYSIFTEDMEGCFYDNFFQEYASNSGYMLTPSFLSQVNTLRTIFSNHINIVLHEGNFHIFLRQIIVRNSDDPLILLDKSCCDFVNLVCSVRTALVHFLTSKIIPSFIDIINKSKVVRGGDECVMSYPDKDRFFLHVVTIFERLIIVRAMSYWSGFCSSNRVLLSSFPDVDYSNPFVRANNSIIMPSFVIPDVTHPVAFSFVHGLYISFMSIDYLNKIVDNCASDFVSKLDPIIRSEFDKISNSSNCFGTLLKFKNEKMFSVIKKGFLKNLDNCCKGVFANFLNELIVWPQKDKNDNDLSIFVKKHINSIFKLVKAAIISSSDVVIAEFKNRIKRGNVEKFFLVDSRKVSKGVLVPKVRFKGKYSMSGQCGFKLDEKFNLNLMNIRADKLIFFRLTVRRKFKEIVEKSSFGDFDWSDISEKLLRIAVDETKEIIDNTYKLLKKIVLEARVVCDDGTERKLVGVEKLILNRNVMAYVNKKFKDTTRALWKDVTRNVAKSNYFLDTVTVLGVSLSDLREEDRSELNAIEEEFIRKFEPILCETIKILLSGIDLTLSSLECVLTELKLTLNEKKVSFFVENGYYYKVISLLSRAIIIKSSVSRLLADDEKDKLLKLYIDDIAKNVDAFVARYVGSLVNPDLSVQEGLSTDKVEDKGKKRVDKYSSSVGSGLCSENGSDFYVVPARFGSINVCREFNDDLNRMISDHLGCLSVIVRSIRTSLESEICNPIGDSIRCSINKQSKLASDDYLSKFMDGAGDFITNVFVSDGMEIRKINDEEIRSFLEELHNYMLLKHNEVLFIEIGQ